MRLFAPLWRWLTLGPDPDPLGLGRVSQETLRHHDRYDSTRGVDLPRWRTPKELAQMRRHERRSALRVVGGKRA